MEEKDTKKFVLNEETDFTPVGLRDFLNRMLISKMSGKPFTLQDVQGYEIKGKIADAYGGHIVQIIKNDEIGIKILRIKGLREYANKKRYGV